MYPNNNNGIPPQQGAPPGQPAEPPTTLSDTPWLQNQATSAWPINHGPVGSSPQAPSASPQLSTPAPAPFTQTPATPAPTVLPQFNPQPAKPQAVPMSPTAAPASPAPAAQPAASAPSAAPPTASITHTFSSSPSVMQPQAAGNTPPITSTSPANVPAASAVNYKPAAPAQSPPASSPIAAPAPAQPAPHVPSVPPVQSPPAAQPPVSAAANSPIAPQVSAGTTGFAAHGTGAASPPLSTSTPTPSLQPAAPQQSAVSYTAWGTQQPRPPASTGPAMTLPTLEVEAPVASIEEPFTPTNPISTQSVAQQGTPLQDVDNAIRATAQMPIGGVNLPAPQPGPITPIPGAQTLNSNTKKDPFAKLTGLFSGTSRKLTFIVLGAVLLLGVGGGVAYFLYSTYGPADQVAKDSEGGTPIPKEEAEGLMVATMSNAMDVGSFRQTFTYERAANAQSGVTGTERFIYTSDVDFTDTNNPKSKGMIDAVIEGAERRIERSGQYVIDPKAKYIKLTRAISEPENTTTDTTVEKLENKWIAITEQNEVSDYLLSTAFYNTADLFDSINRVGGEVVIGNVPQNVQDNMMSFAFMQQVFTLDKYVKTQLNGEEVVRLDVKVNKGAFIEYNALISPNAKPIDTDNVSDSFVLFIDPTARLPKRVNVTIQGTALTIDYSNFNVPVLVEAPPETLTARQAVDAIK